MCSLVGVFMNLLFVQLKLRALGFQRLKSKHPGIIGDSLSRKRTASRVVSLLRQSREHNTIMAEASVFVFLCVASLASYSFASFVNNDISYNALAEEHSFNLVQSEDIATALSRHKRSAINKRDVGLADDVTCKKQSDDHLSQVPNDFVNKFTFDNETKYSLALAWASNSQGGSIIVSVTEEFAMFAKPSTLYISTDEGKSFQNISSKIDNKLIRKDNGLQNHPLKEDTVFVAVHTNGENSDLYRTTDGGSTFAHINLNFLLEGDIVFHPKHTDHLMALEHQSRTLYISQDLGSTWRSVHDHVLSYKWSTWDHDSPSAVYITSDPNYDSLFGTISSENSLLKSADAGSSWTNLKTRVYTFGMEGKFLFVSKPMGLTQDTRVMEVSTDGGQHWDEVQLPSLTEDRFYSILDMSEDLIFMHVDNPDDTGHGVLYISDSTGVLFTESLQKHLYPNFGDVTDFYKVQSMRGVYLASQLTDDAGVRTLISFDRGGEWVPVKRPANTPCKDESKACSLQIHSKFSASQKVNGEIPLSVESAPGIILVHGHVADALQITDPDVFVTSDGGYNWRLALRGPHHYQIADQGGLLVAVPADTNTPQYVKFSTDEGRCWHEYQFTDEQVVFRRLLTQPGNQAMTVAIWGYLATSRQWKVFVIDFRKVIQQQCTDMDYEEWLPHFDNSEDASLKGCLLGRRETFMRLKHDSWCYNGYAHEVKKQSGEICPCTRTDYDCDYGYYRPMGSEDCITDPAFKEREWDICFRGHKEELVFLGYHKVPGDQCKGGFTPRADKIIKMSEVCKEGDKSYISHEEHVKIPQVHSSQYNGRRNFLLAAVVILGLLSVFVIMAYIVKRYKLARGRGSTFTYSSLQAGDINNDLENGSAVHGTGLYEDSSGEEENAAPSTQTQSYGTTPPRSTGTFDPFSRYGNTTPASSTSSTQSPAGKVKGYHDDSDEDLLE